MARTTYRNGDTITLTATGCDGCSPSNINGRLCHETGCPEAWRDYPQDCDVCGFAFFRTESRHERICPGCAAEPEPEPDSTALDDCCDWDDYDDED